jgi:hypothetical protein
MIGSVWASHFCPERREVFPDMQEAPGGVPLVTVLEVLARHGVHCSRQADDASLTVLAKGERIETYQFTDVLYRRILHHLARKYEVPIYHFYNPQMAGVRVEGVEMKVRSLEQRRLADQGK